MRHKRKAQQSAPSFAKRKAGLAAAGVFAAMLFSGPAAQAAGETIVAGITSGQFEVDVNGQVNYTLPIEVPPGTNGHQPEISVVYNSASSDSYLGYGFQIAGLPRIHRCALSEFHDGRNRGIRFDQDDAYCLDGARLIRISGTHGATGAVYRSYQESWARITIESVQTSSYTMPDGSTVVFGGPASFKMVQKDGTTLLFGANTNSRIMAGNGQVNIWAVTSMSDRFGNEIAYNYINNSLRSQKDDYSYYPKKIDYGRRSVVFNYQTRASAQTYTRYVPYTPVKNGRRLTNIMTQHAGTTFKQYNFAYTRRGTFEVDLLNTIKECAGNKCFKPTKFTWGDNPASGIDPASSGTVKELYFNDKDGWKTRPSGLYADFNADGIADYSPAMNWVGGGEDLRMYFGDGDGFGPAQGNLKGPIFSARAGQFDSIREGTLKDLNDDGLPDYIINLCDQNSNCQKTYHGTGSGFANSTYNTPYSMVDILDRNGLKTREVGVLRDFNGDGRLDFSYAKQCEPGSANCSNANFRLKVYHHNGNGYTDAGYRLPFRLYHTNDDDYVGIETEGVLLDFNGDGLLDFSRATKWSDNVVDYEIYHGTGNGFVSAGYKLPNKVFYNERSGFGTKVEAVLQDINGDGLPDFSRATCWKGGSCDLRVYHGTGAGFVLSGYSLPGRIFYNDPNSMNYRREGMLIDMNGDGRLDWVRNNVVRYHTGKGFSGPAYLPHQIFKLESNGFRSKPEAVLQDFNGDGLPDFSRATRYDTGETHFGRHLNRWYGAPRVVKIAEAYGANNTTNGRIRDIQYMRLNDSRSNPKWPDADKRIHIRLGQEPTPPRYVVSSFQDYDLSGRTGHSFETAYQYIFMQSARDGRGFLGFQAISSYDTHTNLTTTKVYGRHYYPYNGVPRSITISGPGGTVQDSQYLFSDNRSSTPGIEFRVIEEETHKFYEAGGIVTTKQTYKYDAYGNVKEIGDLGSTASSADDLYTCSTFINDTTKWRLGFADSVKTASRAGCGSGLLSHRKFTFDQNDSFQLDSMEIYDDSAGGRWLLESYDYDAYGNRTQTIDSAGVETNIVYETGDHTYPASETIQKGALSLTTGFQFNRRYGRMTSRTDANGHTITTSLDDFGRRTVRRGPSGSQTVDLESWTYRNETSGVSVAKRVFSNSNQSVLLREFVDAFGRNYGSEDVASESGSQTIEQSTAFNSAGRPATVEARHYKNTAASASSYLYDARGRPISATLENGSLTTTAYAKSTGTCGGCTLKETVTRDVNGTQPVSLDRVLDSRGNPRKLTHGNGSVQNFTYDAAGRITLMSDGKAQTIFRYDTVGRKVYSHYAKSSSNNYGKINYRYDDAGRLYEIKDARTSKNTLNIIYDDLGRIKERRFNGGRIVYYVYGTPSDHTTNSIGRLQSAYVEINGTEKSRYTFAYNPYGQVTETIIKYTDQENRLHEYSFGRRYDRAGNPTRIIYPDGRQLERTIDSRGQIKKLRFDGTDYAVYGDFTAAGQARSANFSNGVAHDRTFHPAGELKTSVLSRGSTDLLDQEYFYNGLSFPTDVVDRLDSANTQSFEYDAGGYLDRAVGPYGNISYEYDVAGNLTKKGNTTYEYDGHRLKQHGRTEYQYDQAGNRTQKKDRSASKTWDYIYSAEGMLNQVTVNGNLKVRNTYGPFSERIERRDGNSRQSIYFMDLMDVAIDGPQKQYTVYLGGPDGRVAAITRSGLPNQGASGSLAPLFLTAMYGNDTVTHFFKRMEIRAKFLIMRPGAPAFLKFSLLAVFASAVLAVFVYYRRERRAARGSTVYRRRMAAFAPALSILFTGFFVLQCHNDPGEANGFWDDVAAAFNLESAVLSTLQNGATNGGIPTADTTRFYHQDGMRSTALVTNGVGNATTRVIYRPYGGIFDLNGNNDFRPKFDQKELDEESGLYHFGARFYDPGVGRFISADNLAIGGPTEAPGVQNRYQYAGNNPVAYQDPDGNFFWLIFLAPLIFLGGVAAGVAVADAIISATTGDFTKLASIGVAILGFALGFGVGSIAVSLARVIAFEIALGVVEGVATAAIEGKTGMDLLIAGGVGGALGIGGRVAGRAIDSGLSSVSRVGRSMPKGSQCFAAGTLVETEGGLRPIENIKVGDRVLSRKDDATGNYEYKTVKELLITPDNEIGELELSAREDSQNEKNGAQAEKLKVTPEHPFYVPGRGWVEARELRAGDTVVAARDGRLEVTRAWIATGKTTTYNFEVAEFHTYYVSRSRVWVHNVCDFNPTLTRGSKRKLDETLPSGLSTDNFVSGKRARRAPNRYGLGGGGDGLRGPGPFAVASIPGHAGRNFSPETRRQIDHLGRTYGCHACGAKDPGTRSGHHIPDHQPQLSTFPNQDDYQGRLYPHCLSCSNAQGGVFGYRPTR